MSDNNQEYLTVEEAAEVLKVDSETIYRWLHANKLPGTKIGGTWRMRRSDIDALFLQGKS